VPLAECATLTILAAHANPESFAGETGKGQRFTGRPIKRLSSCRHLSAGLQQFLYFAVRMKVIGDFALQVEPVREPGSFDRGRFLFVRWFGSTYVFRPGELLLFLFGLLFL